MGKSKVNKYKKILNSGGRNDCINTRSFKETPRVPCNTSESSVKKIKMTRKKPVQLADCSTQYELQGDPNGSSDTTVTDELNLLRLENCKMRNEYDNLKQENNDLKKINENLKCKIEILQKQLDISNDIVKTNTALKLEIECLREKINESDKIKLTNEELKNEVAILKEKMDNANKIINDYEEKEKDIDSLHKKLQTSEKVVENLVEILSNCPTKQKDNKNRATEIETSKENESKCADNFDDRTNHGLKRSGQYNDNNEPPYRRFGNKTLFSNSALRESDTNFNNVPQRWKDNGNDTNNPTWDNRAAGIRRNYTRNFNNNRGNKQSNHRGRGKTYRGK